MGAHSHLAAAERRDLADYLETLDHEQWTSPSPCPGWSVRDVVGHVSSYDELGWSGFVALFVRSGLSLERSNQTGVDLSRALSTRELIERLRRHAIPRGVTSLFGSALALTDAVIHHQDIRRSLGHPRDLPEDRALVVLRFLPRARALPAPSNLAGLHLTATDLDWAHGDGPEVRGPAEAIIMAAAGREQAVADLAGPGVEILAARVGTG